MKSIDLTYYLGDVKIKSKHMSKSALYLEYFRNIIIYCYDKRKKLKIRKMYLFLLPPTPQLFSWRNFLKIFSDTWVSGQRVGKLTKWQS